MVVVVVVGGRGGARTDGQTGDIRLTLLALCGISASSSLHKMLNGGVKVSKGCNVLKTGRAPVTKTG